MRLAILASGQGTTAEILFKYATVVLTNNPSAGVIEKAKAAGIPVEIVEKNGSLEEYGAKIIEALGKYDFDFISQNGWEMITPANVCEKYVGKTTNNHPAPLDPGHPDFGGKGMKGLAVHKAVLNFAKRINREFNSEVCIHLVTAELDKGELLAYKPVPIEKNDTPETLQQRVKEVERDLIAEYWAGVEKTMQLIPIQRTERVIREDEFGILDEVKMNATKVTEATNVSNV